MLDHHHHHQLLLLCAISRLIPGEADLHPGGVMICGIEQPGVRPFVST